MPPSLDREQLAQRLQRHAAVDPQSGCWLWQGATHAEGYGVVAVRSGRGQRLVRVHRLALWLWAGRSLSRRLLVRQTCGNRRCFNPEHLACSKDRHDWATCAYGQANGRAKLTEAEARMLLERFYAEALTPRQLARLVGDKIKPSTAEALVAGHTWKHLDRPRPAARAA
jgi:hypothetical protein